MKKPKLNPAQRKVMPWLSQGARVFSGNAVEINGERICNVDSMTIPVRLSLGVALILAGGLCAYLAVVSGQESGARRATQLLIDSACDQTTGQVAAGWEGVCAAKLGPDDIEVTREVIHGDRGD